MDCPHCGAAITAELRNCIGCGWKIRLSQILVQPVSQEDSLRRLPISDIYYLFADKFLKPERSTSPLPATQPTQVEELISGRGLVPKDSLAISLYRAAIVWLSVSGHLHLELNTSKRLGFAPTKMVLARPTGIYKAPVGSLESRVLDELYDRQQGGVVEEIIARLIGFWYQGDPYDWVLQVVKHHILASPFLCSNDSNTVDLAQIKRLESKIEYVGDFLEEFASANANLMVALWDSIYRGLTGRKG